MSGNANDMIIEAWNTVLFDKFCRFEYLATQGAAGHSDELLARYPYAGGARVLDVGCGFGDTTREIGRRVGADGTATGVDCASNFIDRAIADTERAGADNVSFKVLDAQGGELGGPYDHAFSRFGTMFFLAPGAALANIRQALVPGGTLNMIVWRKREDNPWAHEAEKRVRAIVPNVPSADDSVHCGPGPFSFSGADMVSDLLGAAGYERITFERFDTDICIGRDVDEAIECSKALGPAGEILRFAGDDAGKYIDAVDAALRETLSVFDRGDGLWAPSSVWFVNARNPA